MIGVGDPTSYTGGSGTLNDSIIPTSSFANQLFRLADGVTITLYLSALSVLTSIDLLGGVTLSNSIPGTLTGWDVTIGGNTVTLVSTPSNANCFSGFCDDSVSLAGTILAGVATSSVTLSNFQGGLFGHFNIGEATVNASPIPEPETYALMLAGLGALVFVARRRRA